MIDIHEFNKLTQLSLRLELREILNSLNFLKETDDALLIDVMTKKIKLCDT